MTDSREGLFLIRPVGLGSLQPGSLSEGRMQRGEAAGVSKLTQSHLEREKNAGPTAQFFICL